MNKRIVSIILVMGIFLMSQLSLYAQSKTHLKCAGCKTEFFLMKDLCKAGSGKSDCSIKPGKTGNKKAIELLLQNKIDFAFTCKPISKLTKKLKLDEAKVASWKSIAIAKDPIVLVTNNECGITNLTVEQITDIFNGSITNWKDVGGKDMPIKIGYIDPKVESGMLLLFKEFTIGINAEITASAKKLDDPAKLGNFVGVTPGGITFMAYNSYIKRYGNVLKIDDINPSNENILNGKYKLAATYYLTIPDEKNETIMKFVNYCLSAEGKKVIGKNFIPYYE